VLTFSCGGVRIAAVLVGSWASARRHRLRSEPGDLRVSRMALPAGQPGMTGPGGDLRLGSRRGVGHAFGG
jgi:hypothetical protein